MKKIILAAIAALTLNTVSAEGGASKFTGFYAGLQAGVNSVKLKFTDADGDKLDTSKRKSSFIAGLFAGYGMGFSSCGYIGGEIFLNMPSTKIKYEDASYKSNFNYGAKVRLGYTVTPQAMVFLGLGAEMARTTLKIGDYKKNKTQISFAPSVGADYFVSNNIFVRAELSYLLGKKQTYEGSLGIKTRQTRFVVGGGYKF